MTEQGAATAGRRYCVVGSGVHYVSGITYFTYLQAEELGRRGTVGTVLMRKLVPAVLYPGGRRGKVTDLDFSALGPTFNGVDWTGFPGIRRARRFLQRLQPDVVIFHTWTGAVFPWFLLLVGTARRIGAIVILELHEDLDSAEARLPVVGRLLRRALTRLVSMSDGYVVHSAWDRDRMTSALGLPPDRVAVIPLGPHQMPGDPAPGPKATAGGQGEGETTILFFGTIRPYKGVEHLVAAFDRLPRSAGERWRLLVVGETWENWNEPAHAIQGSPYREDIEFVNRYVRDDEIPKFLDRADVVALPYLRSSASGPLQITLTTGRPVVVTAVGGLVEAAEGYSGAVFVPPGDVDAIADGIQTALSLAGTAHEYRWTWRDVGDAYERLVDHLEEARRAGPGA